MTFVPGLDLAEALYREVLEPLAGLPHAAALLGERSEVLGFDSRVVHGRRLSVDGRRLAGVYRAELGITAAGSPGC